MLGEGGGGSLERMRLPETSRNLPKPLPRVRLAAAHPPIPTSPIPAVPPTPLPPAPAVGARATRDSPGLVLQPVGQETAQAAGKLREEAAELLRRHVGDDAPEGHLGNCHLRRNEGTRRERGGHGAQSPERRRLLGEGRRVPSLPEPAARRAGGGGAGSPIQDRPLGQSWAGKQPACASVSRTSGESLRLPLQVTNRETQRVGQAPPALAQETGEVAGAARA